MKKFQQVGIVCHKMPSAEGAGEKRLYLYNDFLCPGWQGGPCAVRGLREQKQA